MQTLNFSAIVALARHGDTFEMEGLNFRVTIERDDDMGAPWDNSDGHGPVSGWTTRPARPGERVLCVDRNSKRYYDVSAAMELAKRDGWDSAPYGEPGETEGQRAARAVTSDFEYLRRWCADLWFYVCVGVQVVDADGNEVSHPHAATNGFLCGVESDSGEYIGEVVNQLADEVCRDIGKYGLVYRAAEWVDEETKGCMQ
jgi:hypothetical protein